MARILYIHGLFAKQNGVKATALRRHGHDVRDPRIDYRRPFGWAVRQLQAEFDAWRPDAIVGTSLGAGVAMSLRSGNTPQVLISPMWDLARVSVPFESVLLRAGYLPALVAAAVGSAGPAVTPWLSSVWSVDVPPRVKTETIILQGADDQIIQCRHSRALLARSVKLPLESPMHAVIMRLCTAGYRTSACRPRAAGNDDPRLILIGRGHHCKVASDNCPVNPGKAPLDCLVLAASELAAMQIARQAR